MGGQKGLPPAAGLATSSVTGAMQSASRALRWVEVWRGVVCCPDSVTSSGCHVPHREQKKLGQPQGQGCVCVSLTPVMVFCDVPPREGWV